MCLITKLVKKYVLKHITACLNIEQDELGHSCNTEEQVLFIPPAASLRTGITEAADKGSYPRLVVCSTSSGLKALG